MTVIVHTMGVHYRWMRDMPEALRQQLWLAHNLREDLVTLQHQHEDAVRAIWSSYPQVGAAEARLTAAETEAAAAAKEVATERSRQRSKRVTGPLADRLRAARAAVKVARQDRRDAIAAVRELAAEQLQAASDELRAAKKALYQLYCQDGDLYWCTFNDVRAHHETAARRIQEKRSQGLPAALRHHRYDGTGTVAVQLQRQAADPPRTPITMASAAGKWRNQLAMPWIDPDIWDEMSRADQAHAGRVTVRMRCGSVDGAPQWLDLPVQAHRWLPADADITGARLTVTRCGGHYSARLSITAKVPDPMPVTDGPTVAVHLGWLRHPAGTRVATIRSDAPLEVPPRRLQDVLRLDRDGLTGVVVLPAVVEARLARVAETQSVRDLARDAIRDKLAAWLDEHGPAPYRDREISAADVRAWRSPNRFAALALAWRDAPPPGGEDIAAIMETWRASDRLGWETCEHGRRRALGYRDDLWRQVAAELAGQAGRIVVDDTGVAALARDAVGRSALPNATQQQIDRRRGAASPGLLREQIVSTARREGVPVVTVSAFDLSRTHARCGHVNPADDRYILRFY